MNYTREESLGYLVNWAGRLLAVPSSGGWPGGNAGPMPVFFALSRATP